MERRIHIAVKLLASKVQDERNHPLHENPAVYLRWKTPSLGDPFFSTPEFLAIVDRVQQGQIRESLNVSEEPPPDNRTG